MPENTTIPANPYRQRLSPRLSIAAAQKTKEKKYWLNKLCGPLEKTIFPYDHKETTRSGVPIEPGFEEVKFQLSPELFTRLMKLGNGSDHRLHMILVAALDILLMKYTHNHDIIVGTTIVKSKPVPDDTKLINVILVLRNRLEESMTFRELLLQVRQTVVEATENQNYPFEILLDQLHLTPRHQESPLFGIGVLVENIHDRGHLENIKPDMIFSFFRSHDCGEGKLYYNSQLYEKTSIQRIINHFTTLLQGVLINVDLKLSEIDILTSQERKQILFEFNNTKKEINRDKCYPQLFEEQVLETPRKEAAVHNRYQLTYSALNAEANPIAYFLIEQGVNPNDIVAIYMKRGLKMLTSIIGIFKAGGAYLAIDVDYPEERVIDILEDSEARILIAGKENLGVIDKIKQQNRTPYLQTVLGLDHEKSSPDTSPLKAYPPGNPGISFSTDSLAYVIYTSGTTGKPKGVMIHQLGMLNHIYANIDFLSITEKDIMAQTASPGFDISVWQFLALLIPGGITFIIDREVILEPQRLIRMLQEGRITILEIVPSLMRTFLEVIEQYGHQPLKDLRWMIPTGETLSVSLAREWYEHYPGIKLVNAYGPAEVSDDVTLWEVDDIAPGKQLTIPIGKPLQNLHVYILDHNLLLCPIQVVGEICIAGIGVGKGYLKDPGKTAKSFVPNPYWQEIGDNDYAILYRTGDMAYFTGDGNIEFLGRQDFQVKVRGFRIELEEIESQLKTMAEVKDAVVISRENPGGDKYLCGYVVPFSPGNLSANTLRERLSGSLPYYMVPANFVFLDEIPLTPHGKIDRKRLPEPGIEVEKAYIAPRSEVEKKLVKIWAEVLGLDTSNTPQPHAPLGIDDNFFQLGGHSLKAMTLVSKIHRVFGVKIPLAEVFKTPRIRELAGYIKGAVKETHVPVEPVEKREYYPLSPAQKRMYFIQQIDPASTAYNSPQIVPMKPGLDKERLEEIVKKLIDRHESFRTSFDMVANEPAQIVHPRVQFAIDYYDLEPGTRESGNEIEKIVKNFVKPFSLSKVPLLRATLIKIEDNRHILLIDAHHIITDGVSDAIWVNDFFSLYEGKELPGLRIQYKDYSEWQNQKMKRGILKQQEGYWLQQFSGEIPVLELPIDYPRPKVQSFAGAALSFAVSGELTRSINRMALDTEVTLYMVVLAVYNILLSKLSGQEDIVVGTPVAARRHADLERIIGMFVNTLALRNYPDSEKTTREFLEEVKESTLHAFENQEYQFEDLVERVSIHRDTSRNPLFDTMFVLQNMETPASEMSIVDIPQLKIDSYKPEYHSAKFDLALVCLEAEEELLCSFEYCTKIFKKETIERFVIYFKQVLSTFLENRQQKISRIEIITTEEKQQILYDFNNTMSEYPGVKPLYRLFAEQVEQTPDHIAVVGEMQSAERKAQSIERNKERHAPCAMRCALTYRELNEKSNQLAYGLPGKGVKPDTIVGIMVERSLEMIIGILGILKAGGAYLPIDPDYPEERIQYMLKDSNAQALVVDDTSCASWLSFAPKALLNLSEGHHLNFPASQLPSFPASLPSSLAYVIYTSGSTGKSRGVLVEHGNVVRLVKSTNFIEAAPGDRLLLTGVFVFDITTFEIWYPLLNGITLYLTDQEVILNAEELGKFLVENKISILHLIPQLFNALVWQRVDIFKGLKYFLVGGDLVRPHSINRLRNEYPGVKIIHCYGPTENTTFSTTLLVDRDYQERLPIGRPIQNSSVYIMSRHGKILPIGVAGELCTASAGVARGYLNRPELTAEKFDYDLWDYLDYHDKKSKSFLGGPGGRFFKKAPLAAGGKLYKTGDLARWLPQGSIEFLGRIDYQVKIRGFRIEPGEIESRLLTYNGIKETVVVAKTDEKEDKYLCAYIVSNIDITVEEVRGFLSGRLPDYMIPSYFIQVESIPLTPTGKVDRNALPVPAAAKVDDYIAPQGEIEKKLVEIWFDVLALEKDKISIAANFFQLGGHSLRATIMAAKIHKALNIKIPLAEIFKNPTIRGLAEYIKNSLEDRYASIKPIEKKQYYILSPAQKRLYILQQMELGSTAYNMPEVIPLPVEADIERLEESFKKLIECHEGLRTSFHMLVDKPVQRVHDEVEFEIGLAPLPLESAADIISSFVRPFDLSQAPLIRVGLIPLHTPPFGHPSQEGKVEGKHILMIDMHHIISDGTSHQLLRRDFMSLYQGEVLSPLRIQYKDFSHWQNSESQGAVIKQQENYWLREYAGEIPVLNLPLDYPRPALQGFEGNTMSFEIGIEETRQLKRLSLESNTTLFMILLAIFNVLLSRVSGQEDIIVGTPAAGRRHPDLEQIIGMFVNTLSLRNYPEGSKAFEKFLKELKERTLEAFENQEYQFEDLVERVLNRRDISRNPLFDIFLALQNIENQSNPNEIPGVDISSSTIKPYEIETGISKFDLELVFYESSGRLVGSWGYCTKLFKKETIQRLVMYFQQIVSAVTADRNQQLCQIEIITGEEKRQILYDFNETETPFPKEKTIHRLFEEQVEKVPDQTALVGEEEGEKGRKVEGKKEGMYLSYRELNERSCKLAGLLIEKGVKPDNIVGIMVERSLEMVIGILGILKAGGAYLPLDPAYPEERIQYMLKDSYAQVLVVDDTSCASWLSFEPKALLNLSEGHHLNFPASQLPSFPASLPSSLAYIIYTSGTTGKPKGVMIETVNVVKLVKDSNYIKFTAGERLLITGSIGFDITTFEIWGPLLNGLILYLADGSRITDAKRLKEVITLNRISILHLIPQLFNQMAAEDLDIFAGLKYFLIGGDLVRPFYVNRLWEKYRGLTILHMYGPTEGTTFSTFLPIERTYEDRIPIGNPVSNSSVYIIGRGNELLPIGVVGELGIGGQGIARGYLNNPELTFEKFIFLSNRSNRFNWSYISKKLYKTGDLARWLPGGDIEFLGRSDSQVKLRGVRIELAEIESRLLEHPGIKEVVVQMFPGAAESGDNYLCAYITADQEVSVPKIREYLAKGLPGYMIPSYFVFLERIPLTANGKVDRKALPLSEVKAGAVYAAPRSEIEKRLAALWIEVLGRDAQHISQLQASLGIDDNFFELGGHSLKAAAVISRVENEFKVNVPLLKLFKTPNIRELAEYIQQWGNKSFTAALRDNKDKNLVLLRESPGAAGNFFFLHDGSGGVESYIEFCAHLEAGYNYWGIRAQRLDDYTPQNLSIQAAAAGYIEKIKALQPGGPYGIAGWSLGGLLAFETALQLEQQGEAISFLGLIDAPSPRTNYQKAEGEFTRESEIQWIEKYLPDDQIKEKLGRVSQINEIWPVIINHLEEINFDIEIIKRLIPGPLAQIIPNYDWLTIRELIYYLNIDRTLTRAQSFYIPAKKIKTILHYFRASQSPRKFQQGWHDYCHTPIKFYQVRGNHYSIIKKPTAARWAELFDTALNFDNTSQSKKRKNA